MDAQTHEDAVLELDSTDPQRLEERGYRLPIWLRVERGPSRRVLPRNEVGDIGGGCVEERSGSHCRGQQVMEDKVGSGVELWVLVWVRVATNFNLINPDSSLTDVRCYMSDLSPCAMTKHKQTRNKQ